MSGAEERVNDQPDRTKDSCRPRDDSDAHLQSVGADDGAEIDPTVSVSDAVRPPTVAPTEIVDSIGGYRILEVLGEGGMGVVYEAEQSSPNRRVALKVMRRGHTVDEVHARMFHHEAQALARLRHPRIAAIYESGHTPDGHDFFAMELVRGATLRDDPKFLKLIERARSNATAREVRTNPPDAEPPAGGP
jgi:serine/threonine protein kinase